MIEKIRCGVVGIGYFGKFHVEKYLRSSQAKLMCVADINPAKCNEFIQTYNIPAYTNFKKMVNQIDAVSIAVPTIEHYRIAKYFLEHGKHVLLEKPMTTTLQEADILINLSQQKNCLLQIGYLERFNPIVNELSKAKIDPYRIQSIRSSSFKMRNKDVNVVLDLMIHDIDLILSMTSSPIKKINALDSHYLHDTENYAHAKILFENNSSAEIKANRNFVKEERKTKIFDKEKIYSLDFLNNEIVTHDKNGIYLESLQFLKTDTLYLEINSFLNSINQNQPPLVSGLTGRKSLEIALQITKTISKSVKFPDLLISGGE